MEQNNKCYIGFPFLVLRRLTTNGKFHAKEKARWCRYCGGGGGHRKGGGGELRAGGGGVLGGEDAGAAARGAGDKPQSVTPSSWRSIP